MIKKEDFELNQWNVKNVPIIGSKKIKIDEFTFDKKKVVENPIFSILLILASDLSEKQKEVMNLLEINITDDNNKSFFPREVVEEVNHDNNELKIQ